MSSPAPKLQRLGSIKILEVAGKGGMGVVYRAFDEAAQRPVAVKLLLQETAQGSIQTQRFLRELELLASLSHPNLLRVHGAGEVEGRPYMVSEWLSGQSLAERVEKGGPLEAWEAVELALALTRGVAAAHEHGVLHRDVKPENVVLDPVRGPVLIDFGLAKGDHSAADRLTVSGTFAGTPAFAAPEQFVDTSRVDARADVFALGGTLYYLLTGSPPTGDHVSLGGLLAARAAGAIPSARELVPSVPQALNAIVSRALSAEPEHRYASAVELAAALEGFLEGPARARRSTPSRGTLVAILTLSLVVLGVLGALAQRSSSRPDTNLAQNPSPGPSETPAVASGSPDPQPATGAQVAEDSAWSKSVTKAQEELDTFLARSSLQGPLRASDWRASVAELDSRLAALAEIPPAEAGARALAARGAALADRAHWLPALELLAQGTLRSDRCALTWSSTAAAGQLVSSGDSSLTLPTLKDLAARSPGTPIARLAEVWIEILQAPQAPLPAIDAWLERLSAVQPQGSVPRWLGREVWIAAAFALSRCSDDAQRVAAAGTLDARLERYGSLPCWSQAFVAPYLLGWSEARRAVLTRSQLSGLELLVTHTPNRLAVLKLSSLYASQGYLGALGRLDGLRSGADLMESLNRAERLLSARVGPRTVTGVVSGRRYKSFFLPPGVERVRLVWDLPPGPRTFRLRGAPQDVNLWVRHDGPPAPGEGGTLFSASLAYEEQLHAEGDQSQESQSDGIHQIVVSSSGASPEPIWVTLEVHPRASPQWLEPRSLTPGPSALQRPEVTQAAELTRAGRHAEAAEALTPALETEPELHLLRASLRAQAGLWEKSPLPSAPLSARLRHALTYFEAEAALARRDYSHAATLLEELLREEPRYLLAWEGLALSQLGLGRRKQAFQTLVRVARSDPRQETVQAMAYCLLDPSKQSPEDSRGVAKLFAEHARGRDYLSAGLLLDDPARLVGLLEGLSQPLPRDRVRLAAAQLAAGDRGAAERSLQALTHLDLGSSTLRELKRVQAQLAGN